MNPRSAHYGLRPNAPYTAAVLRLEGCAWGMKLWKNAGVNAERILYELSAHAVAVMAQRQIRQVWVERVLIRPEQTLPDKVDPVLQHALGRIEERMTVCCASSTMAT